MSDSEQPSLIAFHLPQFHPIPENDAWWGKGFTEWTNVVKGRPQFRGHYQPHLPADLGFYDLRLPETRELQAEMAAQAGIHAFAYYHYWFNGRRLLERPVDDLIRAKTPTFPFMCVWANENWTRRWNGAESEVLMEQHYSVEDDLTHIRALRSALTDDRYLCRNGRPVLAIYRSSKLPNSRATTDIWRREAETWGLPGLYLLRIESFPDEVGDPLPLGFDAAVEFQPTWWNLRHSRPRSIVLRAMKQALDRSSDIYSYRKLVQMSISEPSPSYPRWPGVTPGFDNSARRGKEALILTGSSPEIYQAWLEKALYHSRIVSKRFDDGRNGFVFLNAWNEWAEGNHIEPDQRYGRLFMDATLNALKNDSSQPRL